MLKLQKVTNPNWLGMIAPRILDFYNRTKEPGKTYESLFTFYANSIQFGGDNSEFWAVLNETKPVAFAHWMVFGLPLIGSVLFESLHNWSKQKEPINLLITEFVNFGKRKRATVYRYEAYNQKVADVIEKYAVDAGFEVKTSDSVRLYINTKKEK
jgi:hypothetical protein